MLCLPVVTKSIASKFHNSDKMLIVWKYDLEEKPHGVGLDNDYLGIVELTDF